jgi:hypothetical protein
MAGAQFTFPQRVQPSRPIRRFTLQQANSSLPLVKRIVSDIVHLHGKATHYQQQLESLSGREQLAAQQELDRVLTRLRDVLDELSDVGCELKDYRTGLIDFVARHRGRDVLLCWKLGEETIGYWHEVKSGFSGRQPVSELDPED